MRRALRQAARVAGTGLAFGCFFASGALLAWLVVPAVRVATRERDARARRCRHVVRLAWRLFHDALRWAGLVDYDPRRTRLELPPGPFVLIANHPTLLDVTAIGAACPDIVIVVKEAMYRSPLLGPLLRACDYVLAGDGSLLSSAASIETSLARLEAGHPILIFPEGTRSPAGGMGAFRSGAAYLAAKADVPLIPLLVRCEPPTLLRGDAWWRVPPRTPSLSIEQLPAVAPAGEPHLVSARVRALYADRGLDEAAAEVRLG